MGVQDVECAIDTSTKKRGAVFRMLRQGRVAFPGGWCKRTYLRPFQPLTIFKGMLDIAHRTRTVERGEHEGGAVRWPRSTNAFILYCSLERWRMRRARRSIVRFPRQSVVDFIPNAASFDLLKPEPYALPILRFSVLRWLPESLFCSRRRAVTPSSRPWEDSRTPSTAARLRIAFKLSAKPILKA